MERDIARLQPSRSKVDYVWTARFIEFLEGAFQIEHLSSPYGNSYGAGSPLAAQDLLQSVIPSDEMEYYSEILIDEWAALHVIDREFGLEKLLEFDLGGPADRPGTIQFLMLEPEDGRLFIAQKVPGEPLCFLLAIDRPARDALIGASIMTLLAADAAFGPATGHLRLPEGIANEAPDLISKETIRRGIELMVDGVGERDPSAWDQIARSARITPGDEQREDILRSYFDRVYSETNRWE